MELTGRKGCTASVANSVFALHNPSCFSRCLRVPIAIGRFYEQCLWIPQTFLPTNPDLHHGLLSNSRMNVPTLAPWLRNLPRLPAWAEDAPSATHARGGTRRITAVARAPRIELSAHAQNRQAPAAAEGRCPLVGPWCSARLQTSPAASPTADGECRPGRTVCD